MTYPRMATGPREEVVFPSLQTGVDGRPYARNIGEHALDVGDNVWWQDGVLSTRPSLRLNSRIHRRTGGVVTAGCPTEGSSAGFWTETYTAGGVTYLSAFQLDENGNRTGELPSIAASGGTITPWEDGFLAVTDGGILRLANGAGSWTKADTLAHVPLVMRNGKGCSAEEVRPVDGEEYEEINRLTDRFRASYTTDGLSHRFYLPFTGLKNDTVTATVVNDAGKTLTYQVAATATASTAVDGRIMQVNRTGGYIQFVDVDGLLSPLPAAVRENNLVITAAKTGLGGGTVVSGMQQAVWWKADEHRSLLVLSGKADDPSLICWLQPGEMYLPQSHYAHIGDQHSGVTAVVPMAGRLLVFKPHAMYLVTVSSSEGGDRARLSVTLYPSATGCDAPATIQVGDDRVLWLDPEGRVRRLTLSQLTGRQAPNVLSDPISDTLSATTPTIRAQASAVCWKGRYLLRFGNTVWALDEGGDQLVWYRWTLDERLQTGPWALLGDRVDWLCYATEKGAPVWVVYRWRDDGEGTDRLWLDEAVTEIPIPFEVTTKWWDGDTLSDRYRITDIGVEASLPGERLHLSWRTETHHATMRLTEPQMQGQRLPLRLSRFRWLGLTFKGQGYLRWNGVRLHRQCRQGGRR